MTAAYNATHDDAITDAYNAAIAAADDAHKAAYEAASAAYEAAYEAANKSTDGKS